MATLVPHFSLAEAIGDRSVQIDAPTVKALMEEARLRYGSPFSAHIKGVAILVNGRNINLLDGYETKLGANDRVWFVRASAGG